MFFIDNKKITGQHNASSNQNKEMLVEHKMNKYRFVLFAVLIGITAFLGIYFRQATILSRNSLLTMIILLLLLPMLFIVHKVTLRKTRLNWVKYLTITIDLSLAMILSLPLILQNTWYFNISRLEFTLFITFALILFNSLTVLRINKRLVYYGAGVSMAFNLLLYWLQGELIFAGLYTTLFIALLSLFNSWIVNYLHDYFTLNKKLTHAYTQIKEANENINQKNEEITAQSEQIIKHIETLETIQKDHTDSLVYAQKIQRALINNTSLFADNFKDHFIYFRPKSIVTGDFYWVSEVDNKIIIAVSDCTGHGVPGAFMTMLGYSFLNELVNKEGLTEPDKILNELRNSIISTLHQDGKMYEQKDGMDMAIVQLDKKTQKIKFSAANNSLCYIPVRSELTDKKVYEFKGDRMPISFHYKMRHFSLLEFNANKDDVFYLYTDGYIDQFGGPKGKKFKSVPFRRMLLQNHTLPMDEQKNILAETMDTWLNNTYEQVDDITVIGFKIK
jgi:serine phosphatase RsbU (regulator of sigma subunit)